MEHWILKKKKNPTSYKSIIHHIELLEIYNTT